MTHLICKVAAVEIVGDYTLRIQFDDGMERIINFRPVLAGEMFGPLRNLELFARVQIDPDAHTLVWPNGADFDPATLHEWPQHEAALRELARRWERVEGVTG